MNSCLHSENRFGGGPALGAAFQKNLRATDKVASRSTRILLIASALTIGALKLSAQVDQPDAVFCDASTVETATVGAAWNPSGIYGGDGAGAYEYSLDGGASWTSGSFAFQSNGTYNFWIHRLGDGTYNTSPVYGPYTVTVTGGPVDQPDAVYCDTSSDEVTTVGTPWNPRGIYGGDGSGAYQYSLDGGATWTSDFFAFQSPGAYTFYVRKLGDNNYNTSPTYGAYTVVVN